MARLSQRNLVSDSRCWAVHPGQPADRAMNASGLRPMSSNRGDGGHEQANEQDEIFEFLPGVASLMEDLDKRVLVTLRDGRHFVGMMRSFDQYGNVMLEDTYERHILDKMYADERVGLYVIRGENLVLLGELDLAKEASQTAMTEVPLEVLLKEKAAKRQERVEDEQLRKRMMHQAALGFDDYL